MDPTRPDAHDARPRSVGTSIAVRPVRAGDASSWRELWSGFCTFYGVDVPAHVTDATWARLLDPASPLLGYVATLGGDNDAALPVGFVNCVLHPYTWGTQPVCYLEDLFVAPAARRTGAGRALIDHVVAAATEHGWARVYWHTDRTNLPARKLYDRYIEADDFVRYTLATSPEHPPRSAPAL